MHMQKKTEKKKPRLSLRTGFEPVRGDPIGFQVQRLNHSAIAACEVKRALNANLFSPIFVAVPLHY